jgi:hypothetical protein
MKEFLKLLREIRDLLKADREEKKAEKEAKLQEENDKRLVEYALKSGKRMPAEIRNGRDAVDAPIHGGDGDLVPFNLSERERKILQLFYDS